MKILLEDKKESSVHLYQDYTTGNYYYFDGKKLVKLGTKKKPEIGDFDEEDDWEPEETETGSETEPGIGEDGFDVGGDPTEEGNSKSNDTNARLAKLDRLFGDADLFDELEAENTSKLSKDKEKELRKIKANKSPDFSVVEKVSDFSTFANDMKRLIGSQIQKVRMSSWKVPNQRYENSGIMRRGKQRKDSINTPTLSVYFDQSGSWSDDAVEKGKQALRILDDYVKKGQLKINILYFADDISENIDEIGGGTGAGKKLIDHIQATKPTNVLVMTDGDFDKPHWNQIDSAGYITVPGGVWFLFRDGIESKKLQMHLRGRSDTKKYYFN